MECTCRANRKPYFKVEKLEIEVILVIYKFKEMKTKERVLKVFNELESYCSRENFKGWDPYDGLNSRVFRYLKPLDIVFLRLIWIQFFKLSPINFRRILSVDKGWNSKGLSLFLRGYCKRYSFECKHYGINDSRTKATLNKINFLALKLIEIRNLNYSNSCWGYNFDWQNRVFFQPINTPTVVATSFVADSLFEAFELTKNEVYLGHALSSCEFISSDLNRFENSDDLIFSYSPLDQSRVYNASLLGARLLARGYSYTQSELYKKLALKAAKTITERQCEDGSWVYGEDRVQSWKDSFHTGFNLECLYEIDKYLGVDCNAHSFKKGLAYYTKSFFCINGLPKYYDNKMYPIDIHSPAQFLAVLIRTNTFKEHSFLAHKVLEWTLDKMYSNKGYFYYQKRRFFTSKISYMRWSQAWMFYALSEYVYENLD